VVGSPLHDTLVASLAQPSARGHPRSIDDHETESSMYPPVIQFETRQRELRQAAGDREPQPAARRPRSKLALLTWGAASTVLTLILAVLR
jgi:hypothetical protein